MNGFNHIGTWTLFKKEVHRFLKVYNQTLLAPVVTSLLFLAVFQLAIGNRSHNLSGVPFSHFMAAGLIIMSVVQNAFANTSSSFTMGKVLGTIVDYLTPPISSSEMIFAMVFAGMMRGILVGVLVYISLLFFVDIEIYSFFYSLFYLFFASMLLSLLGMLAGVIAESFDQMSAITSYVITPMAFLSGTFYSINNLPEFWQHVSAFNPFFYMIDGFRYGITGYHDGDIALGMSIIIAINITLWIVVSYLIGKGYRIKN